MESIGIDRGYLEVIQELPTSLDEYQYWLGLKERKIYFNDEIDMSIINKAVYWIMRWNEEDDEAGLIGEQRKPITIYLTTNGGDVVSGFALIDAIRSSRTTVITVGVGCCASMGALLLISGHYRVAYPNTVILIHDGNLSVSTSSKKAKSTMNFYEKLDERVKRIVLDNTNISSELYDEKDGEEWYMFADEDALELGLVDEII